jgi:hypothetical protein
MHIASGLIIALDPASRDHFHGQRRAPSVATGPGSVAQGHRALAFSRDGKSLAAAGERGVMHWDTASAGERAAARIGLREVVSLAIGPDGRTLVTGGQDGWVRIWDLATGRQRLAVRPQARYVTALALSADVRALASASACERVVRLRNVATGRESLALRGHTAPVQALAFAPGGRMVATGGSDETVRDWDVPSGRQWAALRCPGVRPGALAFSADGRALAAGGDRAGGSGLGRLRHREAVAPRMATGPTVAVRDPSCPSMQGPHTSTGDRSPSAIARARCRGDGSLPLEVRRAADASSCPGVTDALKRTVGFNRCRRRVALASEPTVALRASVRRHRRAQGGRSTLRSIRPTRARRPLRASVDPTDARNAPVLVTS